jgi:hypothetical protein
MSLLFSSLYIVCEFLMQQNAYRNSIFHVLLQRRISKGTCTSQSPWSCDFWLWVPHGVSMGKLKRIVGLNVGEKRSSYLLGDWLISFLDRLLKNKPKGPMGHWWFPQIRAENPQGHQPGEARRSKTLDVQDAVHGKLAAVSCR